TLHDVTRLGDALPWRQMYDFADFYCAGQALDARRDPYAYEPLHTCEHRFGSASVFRTDPALAIPAPQPPYDFPAFMLLARLDFAQARALAAAAIVLATLLAMLALARTNVPLDVAAIVLALPAGYVELNAGQIVPFALLFLTLAGAALVHRRDAIAGVCAALTAIEPHLGLPVILAALLFVPRARIATVVTLACLAGIAFVTAGPTLMFEYVQRVVPLQAAAEVHFPYQYSLTYALAAAGVSDGVARTFGIASFLALIAIGLWFATRLSRTLDRRELLVFFPAAAAVMAGAYVHVVELCFAIPAATVMAVTLRGWARNASAAALCALMIPWIAVWSLKKLFALSLLLCMLLLVRLQVEAFFAIGTLAALAAVMYAFELRPPVLPDAFRGPYRFNARDVVQMEWAAFVESLRTTDRSWLAIKIPVWAAFVTLLATAAAALRRSHTQDPASISRRI
ncbi:MAG: glycosyltransferase 87 family protein, partial [Candidatus Tumulicola sp.]